MNLIPVKAWNRSVGPVFARALDLEYKRILGWRRYKIVVLFLLRAVFLLLEKLRSDFELEIESLLRPIKSFSQKILCMYASLRFYYGDRAESIGFEIFQPRFTATFHWDEFESSYTRYNGYRRYVDGSGVSA